MYVVIIRLPIWKLFFFSFCIQLVDKVYKVASCKPRRFSYPMVDYLGKDESVFQEKSLRILANTERKRRMEAEKKLEKLLSVHQLDRLLVFNELLQVQNTKDVTDDSSSTSSTSWDEGMTFTVTL